MNITATTTDDQILRSIRSAKDSLAQEAALAMESDLMVGEKLVQIAQRVRNYEALAAAQIQYRNVLENGADSLRQVQFLMQVATRTDDTWSGRDNDSRRSAQDVVRDWANEQIQQVFAQA